MPPPREDFDLPCESHEALFQRLFDATQGVGAALETKDGEALKGLVREQGCAMQDLRDAGPCTDPRLLGLMVQTRDRIRETIHEIETQRARLARQMETFGNRRKLGRAYGGRRGLQSGATSGTPRS